MVPPLLSRMPEVNEAIPMPLGHERWKSANAANWVIACVKSATPRLRLTQLLQIRISAFLRGYPHRTGWRGEMRYGLLNDVRGSIKKPGR